MNKNIHIVFICIYDKNECTLYGHIVFMIHVLYMYHKYNSYNACIGKCKYVCTSVCMPHGIIVFIAVFNL